MPIKDMPGGNVRGCIKLQKRKPKKKRPRSPGAYCAAIADHIEPGWREKRNVAKKKTNKATKKRAKKAAKNPPGAKSFSLVEVAPKPTTAAIKRNFWRLDEELL